MVLTEYLGFLGCSISLRTFVAVVGVIRGE